MKNGAFDSDPLRPGHVDAVFAGSADFVVAEEQVVSAVSNDDRMLR